MKSGESVYRKSIIMLLYKSAPSSYIQILFFFRQRLGQGVMVFAYGGYYRGQWLNDLMHGSGILELKDGSVYDGEFSYNKVSYIISSRKEYFFRETFVSFREF